MQKTKITLLSLSLILVLAIQAQATDAVLDLEDAQGCSQLGVATAALDVEASIDGDQKVNYLAAIERKDAQCSVDCENGYSVSCPAGTQSCSAQEKNCSSGLNGRVICDGQATYCPSNSSCSNNCFSAYQSCADNCSTRTCLGDCQDALSYCICVC